MNELVWGVGARYRQGRTDVIGRTPVPVRPQAVRQELGLKAGLCREMVATDRWRRDTVTRA
jgi:hypothetical protein